MGKIPTVLVRSSTEIGKGNGGAWSDRIRVVVRMEVDGRIIWGCEWDEILGNEILGMRLTSGFAECRDGKENPCRSAG